LARISDNAQVPEPTIQRLSIYLRCLRQAKREGLKTLSSSGLQERSGVPAGQIRKDLSYFGDFGRPGIGYCVESTLERLSQIMHLDRQRKVVIVGAGNLGAALAGYQGLQNDNFRLVGVFDNNYSKIGRPLWHLQIQDITELGDTVRREGVDIGIITTPAAPAQQVAEQMAQAGIKSILNFAPTRILSPPSTVVRNVDLIKELEVICYYLSKS